MCTLKNNAKITVFFDMAIKKTTFFVVAEKRIFPKVSVGASQKMTLYLLLGDTIPQNACRTPLVPMHRAIA
jgi:hypothetical protein